MRPTALIVISDLEFGGAQRQVVELANHMEQFDVHVCTLADYVPLNSSLRDCSRRLHLVKRRWHYDFTVVSRLAALIRGINAKVVHGFLFDAEISTRLAGRRTGIPVIGSERNTGYCLSWSNRLAYRLTRSCVDLTIANSKAGAEFHSRYFNLQPHHLRVVHNGVNVERFQPGDGLGIRAELGLGPEHQVVGMFASFKKQKNHPLLLRAVQLLVGKYPNLRVLFVGDELFFGGTSTSNWKRHVQQVIDEFGLRPRCVFTGNKPDVERYYPACDITVLPSLFEGTPNVALESMSCGVPVVATNVSDNMSVIPNDQAGYVVPLGDERLLADRIGTLLGNKDLRTRMGQQARSWIKSEFSCERLAEKTASVYEEAIQIKTR